MELKEQEKTIRQGGQEPKWLRVKLPTGENYKKVRSLVDEHNLHTICQSGNCPNMGVCWGEGTATFMILGNTWDPEVWLKPLRGTVKSYKQPTESVAEEDWEALQ